MPGKTQTSISLTKKIVKEIDDTIFENPGLYKNRTQFIEESIRLRILFFRKLRIDDQGASAK